MTGTTAMTKVRQKMRGRPAGSMAEQIDNLEIGQSLSSSVRYPLDDPKKPYNPQQVKADLAAMQSTLGAYRARVVDDDFDIREFITERVTAITDSKDAIVATVVISRIK